MQLPDRVETKRTVIRPFRRDDRDAFVSFMTDTKTTSEFMFTDQQKTEDGARAFFDEVVASYGTEAPYFFYAVSRRGLDGFIGVCGVSGVPEEGVFECSVCLEPAARGRGLATEAIRALIGYCFSAYPIETFCAYISPRNPRSVAMARRLGMCYMGRGLHPIHGDESVVYSIGREDWTRGLP